MRRELLQISKNVEIKYIGFNKMGILFVSMHPHPLVKRKCSASRNWIMAMKWESSEMEAVEVGAVKMEASFRSGFFEINYEFQTLYNILNVMSDI